MSRARTPAFALVLLAATLGHAAAAGGGIDHLGTAVVRRLISAKLALGPEARKLDARLRPLAWPGREAPRDSALAPDVPMQRMADGRVRVHVKLAALDADLLARLRAAGITIEMVDAPTARIQALVDAAGLRTLAALAPVLTVRPAEPGRTNTGSVDSEGDAASRADLVRSLGYDGSGTVVGVISDGIDHVASAQATGDLPAVVVPADPRCGAGSGDEGTALLEIVHDLAPGAQLLFSQGITSSLGFINAVNCLTAAGAGVIVDDLSFFDEPFFEDGPAARAVRAAVAAGVSYHSSAGNSAQMHVEQPFLASSGGLHDFGGGDQADDVVVPSGTTLTCVLQWNDPFGASANDYDLYLFDAAMNPIGSSTAPQNGTQDPLEIASVTNVSGSSQVVKVAIQKFAGADRTLEMFCLGGASEQYVSPGSIIGQPALPEVVAVGAIDVSDPGQNDVEPFSSRGPRQIFFPGPAIRPKPDLAGFDGVSISNAGGFPSCPPFCAFFGTSAAAPHSAAVAALLRSKNPFLTPAQILDTLRTSAVDIGPAGFDDAAGAGRLDALAAIDLVPTPECITTAQCSDGNACAVDACDRGTCTHAAVACDDGDVCNGAETCDPAIGCVAGVPLVCADADPCTTDACDPGSGCHSTELPGLDYVACALDARLGPLLPSPTTATAGRAARTARGLALRLARAERVTARARGAGPARAGVLLGRARRIVLRMQRLAARRATEFGQTIVEPIVLEALDIARRMRAVQETF